MFEVPGVRAQQAIVLAALRRHPGRSITVAALAAELNRGLGPDVARISNEDVECTLAASFFALICAHRSPSPLARLQPMSAHTAYRSGTHYLRPRCC